MKERINHCNQQYKFIRLDTSHHMTPAIIRSIQIINISMQQLLDIKNKQKLLNN